MKFLARLVSKETARRMEGNEATRYLLIALSLSPLLLILLILIAMAGLIGIVLVIGSATAACTADVPLTTATAEGWVRVGATIDPTYSGGAYQQYYNGGLSYAELGATPGYPNYVGGLIAQALGVKGGADGLPAGYAVLIRAVGSNGPGYRILKSDIGSGQAGDLHYVIDLHPKIAQLIGFNGKSDVEIKVAGKNAGAPPTAPACSGGTVAPGNYINPFRHSTRIAPLRVDMGVDYGGAGPIETLGTAEVTEARTGVGGNWVCSNSTNGDVTYKLLDGPDAGRYVYTAEDVTPTAQAIANVGKTVPAGTPVATFTGSSACIETGWASGPGDSTEASALGQQAGGGDPGAVSTFCGKQFSDLLHVLGAPAGIVESSISGSACQ